MLLTLSLNDFLNGVALVALITVVYVAILAAYRLFFHPLRKFPGPKAAAATYWYEFYYDVVYKGGGQYFRELEAMHQKYGMWIRKTR